MEEELVTTPTTLGSFHRPKDPDVVCAYRLVLTRESLIDQPCLTYYRGPNMTGPGPFYHQIRRRGPTFSSHSICSQVPNKPPPSLARGEDWNQSRSFEMNDLKEEQFVMRQDSYLEVSAGAQALPSSRPTSTEVQSRGSVSIDASEGRHNAKETNDVTLHRLPTAQHPTCPCLRGSSQSVPVNSSDSRLRTWGPLVVFASHVNLVMISVNIVPVYSLC